MWFKRIFKAEKGTGKDWANISGMDIKSYVDRRRYVDRKRMRIKKF